MRTTTIPRHADNYYTFYRLCHTRRLWSGERFEESELAGPSVSVPGTSTGAEQVMLRSSLYFQDVAL